MMGSELLSYWEVEFEPRVYLVPKPVFLTIMPLKISPSEDFTVQYNV